MTLSLRARLTVLYTGILGSLLTGFGAVAYHVLALQLDADATANVTEMTNGLHGYLRFHDGVPVLVYDRGDPEEVAFVSEATRYYQVFDVNTGRALVQSPALEPLGLRFTREEVQAFRERSRLHDIQTDRGRIRISSSLIAPVPGETYLLQVGASLDAMDSALERVRRLVLWGVPAGVLLALLVGRWAAGRALAPLARLATAARAIDVADLTQRVPVRGAGDELDEVAGAFNDALGRLERAVAEMRQFSTALAHELRTPLAALRGEIELALMRSETPEDYKRGLESQLEELDTLARLITQLLTLARAEAGEIRLAREPVALGDLAATVVDQLQPVAQAGGMALACEIVEPITVRGDARWLERLLLNLLDNAIKFTPDGGQVSVRVFRDRDLACLEVRDTGIGLSPDAIPRVFEPFFRADPARSSVAEGAGLGLSLVKWIADRHGARIEVVSQPNQGSTFTVRLPALP